jgi:hypothetical protein
MPQQCDTTTTWRNNVKEQCEKTTQKSNKKVTQIVNMRVFIYL